MSISNRIYSIFTHAIGKMFLCQVTYSQPPPLEIIQELRKKLGAILWYPAVL
jgi:hypothetical protein